VISWGSKKQTCITNSTMESEFIALAVSCKEAKWLWNLLVGVPLWRKPFLALTIYCDSGATLRVASKTYNNKSRHISLKHNYVHELLNNGVITVEYVKSIYVTT
jgi:hypothetical protein